MFICMYICMYIHHTWLCACIVSCVYCVGVLFLPPSDCCVRKHVGCFSIVVPVFADLPSNIVWVRGSEVNTDAYIFVIFSGPVTGFPFVLQKTPHGFFFCYKPSLLKSWVITLSHHYNLHPNSSMWWQVYQVEVQVQSQSGKWTIPKQFLRIWLLIAQDRWAQ